MSVFQDTKEQTDQQVMVQLISTLAEKPTVSQRELSRELNIALGLMNRYLQRCLKKGFLRATQVAPKRWAYFVTPQGLHEKSKMVANYLSGSLTFFRDAKNQCEEAIGACVAKRWTNIALVGEGDLAEIVNLVSNGVDIKTTLISPSEDLRNFDAILITDIQNPQGTYNSLKDRIAEDRLLTLGVLHISRQELKEVQVG